MHNIGSANVSATVAANSFPITSVTFTLLTDDIELPAGSDAALSDTTSDNQNPTATLTTRMAGTYSGRNHPSHDSHGLGKLLQYPRLSSINASDDDLSKTTETHFGDRDYFYPWLAHLERAVQCGRSFLLRNKGL